MALPQSRLARLLIGAVMVAVLLAATHSLWMGALGTYLVSAGPPCRAEIAVVLAGDDLGYRILKAAELVKEGYVPLVLVSGPVCCYARQESELAIDFAVHHGYPAGWFVPLPMDARSTREEAVYVVRELRRRDIHHFLLVTSDYHTRRAAGVYRRLVPPDSFHVVAAPDRDFTAHGWWHSRDGQKRFVLEWMKTVAYWAGM